MLVTFDGAPATTHAFRQLNDPVMGGQSSGSWNVNADEEFGIFDGRVVDVPKLSAPGFIKTQASSSTFPDISSCTAVVLKVRSSTDYGGYRFSFGTTRNFLCAFFSGGYKTRFDAPVGTDFQSVELPFTEFSNCNSDSTGEPIRSCANDNSVCPDQTTLRSIETVAFWGEGVDGAVHLEIKSISAIGCAGEEESRTSESANSGASVTESANGSRRPEHERIHANNSISMYTSSNGALLRMLLISFNTAAALCSMFKTPTSTS